MGGSARPVLKKHQVVVRIHGGKTRFSCQCRASEHKHSRQKGGGEYYEPFDLQPGESMWQAYNRPENHWVEFTDADKVKA